MDRRRHATNRLRGGAIALTSGARSLKAYLADMQARGQTAQRIADTERTLRPLAGG